MKTRVTSAAAVGVALLLSFSVLAQQPQQKPQQQPGQMMSMDNMMKGCREHCEATTKSIDQMTKTMADARQSNDPAKMRAALDQAQKPLGEMQEHMKMCMNMMTMMQNMQQMMGGQQKPPR